MQLKSGDMEEGKDPSSSAAISRGGHVRGLPHKMVQILVLFLFLCLSFSMVSIYMMKNYGKVLEPMKPSLESCVEEEAGNDLEQWIKPPSNLMHAMTDAQLLWRASFMPRVKKYPFKRVPKIAFMFLTKGPLPLAPLWEIFFKGNEGKFSIYIHSSPSFKANFTAKSVFYKRQIPSQVAEWGKMSICDAERRLLANALLDISNEWFVLLSESCIPLHNFTQIYTYIKRSKHSFMGSFDDPGPYGRGRYDPNMSPEVNITQWRKGSQWFEVNRNLALYIVEDVIFYPKFMEFCKPACYVDEHYYPTMLTIKAASHLANRSLTLVDWSRGGAHPATFGRSDITEAFMKRLLEGHSCIYNGRNSSLCYLFARKFAPSALEPLIHLAPKYLGL
ncbi:unnamed protein product [Cuscuta epithymum]|uniref:Core-2/I-branching beta-1,6-N-acetylglucosaminyltransferase family protein n=1 Tax=Cuscuta epithymum TaxID=186058 RepID=A0AAV0EMK1_9ASTE|nr:unnamed protein product [Cuscuta epithymum]CAH9125416.1 unnamed protein product [Cuscuta epithymum]